MLAAPTVRWGPRSAYAAQAAEIYCGRESCTKARSRRVTVRSEAGAAPASSAAQGVELADRLDDPRQH